MHSLIFFLYLWTRAKKNHTALWLQFFSSRLWNSTAVCVATIQMWAAAVQHGSCRAQVQAGRQYGLGVNPMELTPKQNFACLNLPVGVCNVTSIFCSSFGPILMFFFTNAVVWNFDWATVTQQINNSHFNFRSISSAILFRLMDQGLPRFLFGSKLIKSHTKRIKSAGWSIITQQGLKQILLLIGFSLASDFTSNSKPLKC